jgi:glycerophosphoryl diester phosphodiesterase
MSPRSRYALTSVPELRRTLPILALATLLVNAGCQDVEVQAVPAAPFDCGDEEWQSARKNPRRFIAHAAGQIDGHRYTNALEALDLGYESGLRLFEIDLIQTRDGQYVGAHSWDAWRAATGLETSHPTHREFKDALLFHRYHPLDLADLDRWFRERSDAWLVTDKISDFDTLLAAFSHRRRLIVEVFSVDEYHRAVAQGVLNPMLALIPALSRDGRDKVHGLLRTTPVKFVSVPSRSLRRESPLLAALRRNKTCVYAYTSSDPAFLERNFGERIYGAYIDRWDTRLGGCDAEVCDTY